MSLLLLFVLIGNSHGILIWSKLLITSLVCVMNQLLPGQEAHNVLALRTYDNFTFVLDPFWCSTYLDMKRNKLFIVCPVTNKRDRIRENKFSNLTGISLLIKISQPYGGRIAIHSCVAFVPVRIKCVKENFDQFSTASWATEWKVIARRKILMLEKINFCSLLQAEKSGGHGLCLQTDKAKKVHFTYLCFPMI